MRPLLPPASSTKRICVKCALASLLVAAVLSWTCRVRAEVQMTLPAACGSVQEFRAELRELLGEEATQQLHLRARLTRLSDGRYRLQLDTETWSRTLEDRDCQALVQAGVVVVAATVQRGERARGSSSSAEASPPQQEAAPSGGAEREAEGFVFAAGGATWGSAPATSGLASWGGGVRWGTWGASAAVRWIPPTSHNTRDELGLRLSGWGARLAGSWDPTEIFHLVLGVSVTRFEARGLGVVRPATDDVYLPAAEAEVWLRPFRWRHWALDGVIRGRWGLTRPRFEIEPETVVYVVPRGGASVLFRGLYFF